MKTAIFTGLAVTLAACAPRPDMATQRAAIDAMNWAAADQPLVVLDIPARNTSAVLGLTGMNAGARTWASGDMRGVTESGGIILRSAGFGHDLMATDPAPVLAALAGGPDSYTRAFRHLTADNRITASEQTCRLEGPTATTTTVVGKPRSASLFLESCKGADGTAFTNRYWRQGSTMIRSEQWLSQALGSVTVEFPTE